jgi:tetratricopeptide (TPR) repeat protein
MRSRFFHISVFFVIAFQSIAPIQVHGASADTLVKVANAILNWDGKSPGDLFKAVKSANPDAAAIVSMRELNKAIAEKSLPAEVLSKSAAIEGKQQVAQEMVRKRVLDVRSTSLDAYRRSNPEKARALYGIGDIGSWPDKKKPDASMDIDCTVFGVDPEVTDTARDHYVADLVHDLVGEDSGLTLQDFDVVITAEGHEVQAGVFETEGGIDWAKRNMKRVTIIHPDGGSQVYTLGSGDPVGQMAMAENMARLRDMATKGGDYDTLFDEKGFLKKELFNDPSNTVASELWNRYMDMLSKAGMDFYRSNSSTATGGCLDMAKHLNEEVLTKKFEPQAKLKKTLKYVARGDNISRGVPGLEKILAADPMLGDPAYRDVIDLAKTVQKSSDAQIASILKDRFGDTPDAALQELGNKSRRAILRMAEVSYQFEMDRIVLDLADKGQRQAALDKLASDMRVIADEGGDYSDLARTALDHIGKMTEANKSGDIDVLRTNYQSLETIRQADQSTISKTAEFMNQTELGRKMMDMGGKVLELGKTPIEIMETAQFKSSGVEFVGEMVDGARANGLKVMDYAGSVTMWAEVVDSVRKSKSDAELAIALGQTLINNTFFGMVLNTAYAGIVQGDNEALAKAIMYMLIPETALGALVEALGVTAINVTAQTLFDAQMEKAYLATSFDKDGSVSDFSGLGSGGLEGAREFVDILCDGAPEEVAQDLVDKSKATDFGKGANVIAIRTIAKSVRSTVDNGNPLVFTEDGPLMTACARIRKATEDINDCAKIWGVEIALAASGERDLPGGLDKGQTRAFVTMFEQRQKARESARQAIAEAMVRTFEERHRAEVSLDEGAAVKEYEALLRLFKQLGIETEGSASLDQEGSPYNVISSWMASDREKQVNAVKAVQKFKDAYSFVLQSRNVAEDTYANIVGAGSQPLPRPLTGSLPLTAKPDMDVQIARAYLSEVSGLGAKVLKDLELIKQSPLEGAYDKEMVDKLYDVRFKRAYWSSMMRAAGEAQKLHWKVEIFDKQALYDKHKEAALTSGTLSEEDAALMLEFRKHYEIAGDFVIDLSGPERIESGQKAELACRVRVQAPGQEPRDVPEDIARQLSFAWKAGKAALGEGKAATRSYTLETVGRHVFTVTVTRAVLGSGKTAAQVVGSKDWTVEVVVPAKQAEEEKQKQQQDEEAKAAQATKDAQKMAEEQAAKDVQKKAEEQSAKDTQGGATSTSAQSVQIKDDGTWFTSGLAGGWTVEHNKTRHWSAKMKREISAKSKDCPPQTVHGSVSAKLESSFLPKPEEIDAKLRGFVEGNGWYPEEESMQSFSLGKFKGKMIISTLKYKAGFGNPMAGYRGGTAHVHGYALALHESERQMISINFSVYGGSCWDNSGKDNAMSQARSGKAEALGIIQALSLHETQQESPAMAGAPVVESVQAEDEKEKKYQLTLTRVSPASGPVVVGTPVTYKAVLSGDKPEGEVRFHFQPHPEVAFTPYDSPSGSTTAVFSKPDTVGVWVTAVDRTGTIATADQLEIEVQKPRLELVMDPREPLVGQEVKARIVVTPEVKDIDLRWMPVPGNAKHVITSKDNRELTFYLKDEKSAEIQVNARVPFSGEDLGEARASVTAKKYAITVSAPKSQGPPPQIWKEGVGLVTVDKAIAVDQIVEFSVAMQPAVLSGPVKYQWKVENGPCRVSNPSSSVARVTANAAGSCELSVTVRDRNDVELGSGQGGFSAIVTQEVVKQGQQKAQGGTDAAALIKSATDKARKGDYDGAIQDAEKAVGLDPKNTAATALADTLRKEQEKIHAQLAKTRQLMEENRYGDAQKELIVAKNLNGYYPLILEAEEELRVRWNAYNQEVNDTMHELRSASEKKEFTKALEIAAAWRAATKIDPHADKELKEQEDWARKWKTQKDLQLAMLVSGIEKMKTYEYAGALQRFTEGFANGNNIYNGSEPEYKEAKALQAQAASSDKRLKELVPVVRAAVENTAGTPADNERGIKAAEEALNLQPNNSELVTWRQMLLKRAGKAQPDSGTPGSGLQGSATPDGGAPVQASSAGKEAAQALWKEAEQLQLGQDYAGALQKYKEGLNLHADPTIVDRIKKLEKYVALTKGATPKATQPPVQAAPSSQAAPAATEQAPAVEIGSLVGEWEIVGPRNRGTLLILEQSGAQFSGRAYPDQAMHDTVISGTVSGNTVSFARTGWKQFANLRQDFTGTVGVDKEGRMFIEGTSSQNGQGSTWWKATKLGLLKSAPEGSGPAPNSGQGLAPSPTDAAKHADATTQKPAAPTTGWKPVTLGNVSFAIPASWTHKTGSEPGVEVLHLFWDGDFDAPKHGVSGGVSIDYATAKKEMVGAKSVTLNGASVLRVEDGPAINLLFPPMTGNKGVAMVIFRGPSGAQATIDAVLKTMVVQ